MEWERLSKILKTLNWAILLGMSALSGIFMSPPFTVGILIGGLMIIGNFHALQYTVRRCFSVDGTLHIKKGSIIFQYYLRLAIMGVLIYLAIGQGWVHPVGLAVGLSIVVVSIVSAGIHLVWKTSREAI